MKILWIVNIIFPAPSKVLGLTLPVVGGWMYAMSEKLSITQNHQLAVACVYSGSQLKSIKIDNIIYFLLPCKDKSKYDKKLESAWQQVNHDFSPDIVHIHGTEYAHGLSCMRKLPHLNYVVSIQGLKTVYHRYYYGGISYLDIIKNLTLRDFIKRDSLFQQKQKFKKHSILEKEYLQRTKNIIGRTDWDYAHSKVINPKANYHFCNESLRGSFYTSKKWSLETCSTHSIFLSQAAYPIKGLHQVIKAVAHLKYSFPNIKVRVGGNNIIKKTTFIDKFRRSGYGNYINSLLKQYNLQENVIFLGRLTEKEMITEYLKAHVFVCPSIIENSPNSLGEAQILGVPTISSYVGGISEMTENGDAGLLYRFEEIEMLSNCISQIFNIDSLAIELSKKGIKIAEFRHDRDINVETINNIYTHVYE